MSLIALENPQPTIHVVKRDATKQRFDWDKIRERIHKLCKPVCDGKDINLLKANQTLRHVDPDIILVRLRDMIRDEIRTEEVDTILAECCAYISPTTHPEYVDLAARVVVSNHHKSSSTSLDLFKTTQHLYYHHPNNNNNDTATTENSKHCAGVLARLERRIGAKNVPKSTRRALMQQQTKSVLRTQLGDWYFKFVEKHHKTLQAVIDYDRDYMFSFFGFKTLLRSYLLKDCNGVIVESPQELFMRVSIQLHGRHGTLVDIIRNYNMMSRHYFIHASPTLFNSGAIFPQLSSCFLITLIADSIEGIYDTLKQCAIISKYSGGIGVSLHNMRAKNSLIKSTNGRTDGIVNFIKLFNETARAVNQGSRRKGAFAVYLEPCHADIFEFLDMRKTHIKEQSRALDLFYALWVPDIFMERVEADGDWPLFSPDETRDLCDLWGEAYRERFLYYEEHGVARRTIKAMALYKAIVASQIETGTPYMMYKDTCNRRSNQRNLGTIRSSNLCCEIMQYSSAEEVAVCNLASVALSRCVDVAKKVFDHQKLYDITYWVTRNLDRVIDVNYYPLEEARLSNMRHRPMGIGVQGLADVFCMLRMPFTSDEAKVLNRDIFETMYFAALNASCDLAKEKGPYSSYEGSPASQGLLQFDLCTPPVKPSSRWDFPALKQRIHKHGLRNSLLLAAMPTASSAQILGNNECMEPFTDNLYVRRVLAGNFLVFNSYLVADLVKLNLWNAEIRAAIIKYRGSIQMIEGIPGDIKALYKTIWEIRQKDLVDMAADRGAFIDQSQSFNVFMDDHDDKLDKTELRLASLHMYAWKQGLKTGMYYLRHANPYNAVQFTLDPDGIYSAKPKKSTTLQKKSSTGDGVTTLPALSYSQDIPAPKMSDSDSDEDEDDRIVKMCLLSDPSCTACQ